MIDFHAHWCGPCKLLTPTLRSIVEEHSHDINLLMVNIDNFSDIAEEHDVNAIPCVKIYKQGKIIGQFVGVKSREDIEKLIEDSVNK